MAEESKFRKLAYWGATGLFCLGMVAGGSMDILQPPDVVETMKELGYPLYFFMMLGIAKFLGVVTLLVPGFKRLKEWAYAGFTINLVSATVAHAALGHPLPEFVAPLSMMGLGAASYVTRPENRKL